MVITERITSQCLGDRDIFIYLPPGYDEEEEYYPVLYMQDGQNIFSTQGDAPYGKWDVDITADQLIDEGKMEKIIIVGVSNSEWRDYEYTPTVDDDEESGGYAGLYLRFMTENLLPAIQANFRVRTDSPNVAICGSSLGGLLSLYAAVKASNVFGTLVAMSPSIWWDNGVILDILENWQPENPAMRIWLDMGYCESGTCENPTDSDVPDDANENINDSRRVHEILLEKGFQDNENLFYFEDPWGRHQEETWGGRMQLIFQFLFPREE